MCPFLVISPTETNKNNNMDQVPDVRAGVEVCSEMDAVMTISGDVSNTGVTTFTNEACEAISVLGDFKPSTLVNPQADLQDLKTYFARPRQIGGGTIAFGNRTPVFVLDVDVGFLTSTFPQYLFRLSGVYGITFTLNFRVQVVASPFNQGLLALNWQYEGDTTDNSIYNRHLYSASCTHLPHVRLDLSEQTMVEMSIPFLWHSDFFSMSGYSQPFDQYGVIALNTILPAISDTGLPVPSYKIYCYLTDMQFFGAQNNTNTTIVLQSGSVVKTEMQGSHLLSSGLNNVAKVANFVGKNIPSLSAIAGPTAWVAETAAGIAKYFGYSKPILQDPPLKVMRTLYAGESQVDIAAPSWSLGPMQTNTLDVTPEFAGTDIDEMSFDFIKKRYSQICVGEISTTDAQPDVIYACVVSPSSFWFRAPSAKPFCNNCFPVSSASLITQSGNAFQPSCLLHLASNFRLWRGSFKFRFTFAKTKFHAGRYYVSYTPRTQINSTAGNTATIQGPEITSGSIQPYGYSMIIDLKDGNVFDFSIPYLVENPYLTLSSNIGGLSMCALDPLIAPDTVPNTVKFLVEVAADDDFEVADYSGPYFVPTVGNATIYQQSGDVVAASKSPASSVIGERIMSVKQLIQIPWWRRITVGASTTLKMTLAPWYTSTVYSALNAGLALPNSATIALFGAFNPGFSWGKCFVFARGGSDTHVYGLGRGYNIFAEQAPGCLRTVSGNNTNYAAVPSASPGCKVISCGEHPVHIRSPFYSMFRRIPTYVYDKLGITWSGVISDTYSGPWRAHLDRLFIENPTATAGAVIISSSAADDASLGHYIGPPLMYIPNSTNSNLMDGAWPT